LYLQAFERFRPHLNDIYELIMQMAATGQTPSRQTLDHSLSLLYFISLRSIFQTCFLIIRKVILCIS